MTVPFLEPGQTDDAVPRMKGRLVRRLVKLGKKSVVITIAIRTTTYGPDAVEAVRVFQHLNGLHVDGRVGKDTWGALGVHEPVSAPSRVIPGADVLPGGKVIIAAGANKPGRPIEKLTLDYVARMADRFGKPIVITTGTNHDKFTTSGNISDHFSGHAADIGMHANGGTDDGPVGDKIMEAALVLAGVSTADAPAQARGGGLFTFTHEGQRIQCIWKTDKGGNHHNHVHVGVRPA